MTIKSRTKFESAELFARKRHLGQLKKDGITCVIDHLAGVVLKLKRLGITDEDVLCAGWLHDVLEATDTSFEKLQKLFGKRTSFLVLSLTKDKRLPKRTRNLQYVRQLKNAPMEAKMIKLCDISSNLKDIHNSSLKRSTKAKAVKQIMYYFDAIRDQILENHPPTRYLKNLIDDINRISIQYGAT